MATFLFIVFHIATGVIGLLSGATALFSRKGSRRHRVSGKVFILSMMIMSSSGAYIAFFKPDMLAAVNGILTFYLVASGWMAVRRKAAEIGRFEWVAMLVAVALSVVLFYLGFETAAHIALGIEQKYSAGTYYFFGCVAAVAALLDIHAIYCGGLRGAHRIARHLWRMCFALFIATTSFFLGQAQVFPEAVRRIELLVIPVLIVVLVSIYWLLKVLFNRQYKTSL